MKKTNLEKYRELAVTIVLFIINK